MMTRRTLLTHAAATAALAPALSQAAQADPREMAFRIPDRAARARYVASVCTGSLVLSSSVTAAARSS